MSNKKPIGVWKQMPAVSAGRDRGAVIQGTEAIRQRKQYDMSAPLKAPMPYPGGKSRIAAAVHARFGTVDNRVEPFCGSAAFTLSAPDDGATETINDLDGFVTNAYRAIEAAPDETAYWCDRPVNEADLTAVHLWLKAQRDDLTARLFADIEYYDPKVAGRWLWGAASWIGDGWCVADGPWINVDGRLVNRRTIGADVEGVHKKMPHVGRGEHSESKSNLYGIQAHRGVPRQMPEVGRGQNSQHSDKPRGVQAHATPGALLDYFARLQARLRRVRILCGDWRRVLSPSITVNHGTTSIFMDAPYPQAEHAMAYHGANDVWHAAAAWAIEHGDDPRLRLAVCGYHSEETDALFPATWERLRWEAAGGYGNQADGRGRANAKREVIFFSPHCLKPSEEAKAAFSQPIKARDADYTGTMFE